MGQEHGEDSPAGAWEGQYHGRGQEFGSGQYPGRGRIPGGRSSMGVSMIMYWEGQDHWKGQLDILSLPGYCL